LADHLDSGLSPAVRQLPQIATELQKVLTNATRLIQSLDTGYGANTQFTRDVGRALVQLNEALSSIRALADLLSRDPSAFDQGPAYGSCPVSGARHFWRTTVLASMLFLCACTASPPTFYAIAPGDGAAQQGGPKIILLQQIGFARYLERFQIVRSSENYRMDVMPNDWGESIGAMLSRVLLEELGQRLPSVVLSENGAVSSPAEATIEPNLRRLDEDSTGKLIEVVVACLPEEFAQPSHGDVKARGSRNCFGIIQTELGLPMKYARRSMSRGVRCEYAAASI
jgi:uncharacterized lipoprotein YmbA